MTTCTDIHCSHGSDRSWTDPVTNWTLISGVKFDTDMVAMMQIGKCPRRLFSPFVHELMHHWCFHSPVGLALANIQLRARRRAILFAQGEHSEGSEVDPFDLLEDVGRYDAITTLMRPLAEGLALFAEFDLMPGQASTISLVSRWVGLSFSSLSDTTLDDPNLILKKVLVPHRLSTECSQRKSNLLADQFRCDRGGYLPGYLLVKNLWYTLVFERGCSRLFDKDLYMQFMRAFFYEDFGFVAVLLDDNAVEMDALNNISAYFQRRFQTLLQITNDEVAEFELHASKRSMPSNVSMDDFFNLRTDVDLADIGKRRLTLHLEKIDFEGDVDSVERVLKREDQWTLARRDLMCVGRFNVHVRINSNGRVLVWGDSGKSLSSTPTMSLPRLDDAECGEGDGLVEYFISPSGMYRYCTVSVQDAIVALCPLSLDFPEELKQQVKLYTPDSEAAMSKKSLYRQVIAALLEQETLKNYLDHYHREASRISNSFYQSRSLMRTPDEHVSNCAETMRRTGIFAILDDNPDMLHNLSTASLLASLSLDVAYVRKELSNRGISLDALLDSCAEAHARYNVPLAREHKEVFFTYV